ATLFVLLGLHPGPDFDAYAAAALANTDLQQAARALDRLARAHLVHSAGTGRFGMHDLLRAYAAELVTVDVQRQALDQLFGYYGAVAATAMDPLHPAESRHRPRVAPAATPVPHLADPRTAESWLDAERRTLVHVGAHAAAHGWPSYATTLSATLFRYVV